MKARYYPWAIAGGLCVVAVPGSELWLIPAGLAVAHMVYDAAPEAFHAQGRRLLGAVGSLQLPSPRSLLPVQAEPAAPLARASQQAAPAPAAPSAPAADEPLFRALEQRPHQLVIGHTGGGKTTLLHDRATSWAAQGQRVYVCDPDAAPGQWPGCIVAGGGDDYGAITTVLGEVDAEFKRRSQARSQGTRTFAPLHLVIDESQETIGQVEDAWDVLEPVIRRGRKLGMHLTLGVQDDQVHTLDLEGRSHLLKNLITVELLQEPDGRRVALLKDRVGGRALQTLPVPQLRDPESLIVQQPATGTTQLVRRAEQPAQVAARVERREPLPVDFDLLASMLGESVPSHQEGQGTQSVPVPIPGNGNGTAARSEVTVTPGNGSGVTVNVDARAVAGGAGRRTMRGRGIDVKARRLTAAYRQAGAAGRSFRSTFAELGGSKDVVFPAWQAGRATKGDK